MSFFYTYATHCFPGSDKARYQDKGIQQTTSVEDQHDKNSQESSSQESSSQGQYYLFVQ